MWSGVKRKQHKLLLNSTGLSLWRRERCNECQCFTVGRNIKIWRAHNRPWNGDAGDVFRFPAIDGDTLERLGLVVIDPLSIRGAYRTESAAVFGKLFRIGAICINAPDTPPGDPRRSVVSTNEYDRERLPRSGSITSTGNRLDCDLIEEGSAVAALGRNSNQLSLLR